MGSAGDRAALERSLVGSSLSAQPGGDSTTLPPATSSGVGPRPWAGRQRAVSEAASCDPIGALTSAVLRCGTPALAVARIGRLRIESRLPCRREPQLRLGRGTAVLKRIKWVRGVGHLHCRNRYGGNALPKLHVVSLALALVAVLLVSQPANAASFGSDEYNERIFELINQEREKEGLSPLAFINDGSLASWANQAYFDEGRAHVFGSAKLTRLYSGDARTLNATTENQLRHVASMTPELAVQGWMNSPGHRDTILLDRATHLAVSSDIIGGSYFVTTHHVVAEATEFLPGDWSPTLGEDGRPAVVDSRRAPCNDLDDTLRYHFRDLSDSIRDSVACIFSAGITQGAGDDWTRYAPNDVVTRQVMATFMVRAIERTGYTFPESSSSPFPDVNTNSVHGVNVVKLANAGVIDGYGDGSFRPDATVSRAAMTKFMVNSYELAVGVPRPDAAGDWFSDDDGSVLEPYINRGVEAGWVAGRTDGSFGGNDSVTRGHMAHFLARWYVLTNRHARATG